MTAPLGPETRPGPVVRGFLTLLFRLALGLSLLNSGLAGYLYQKLGTRPSMMRGFPYMMRGFGMGPAGPAPTMPGVELYDQLLPYVAIAVGLALVLGFLTRYAAGVCGLVFLLEPLKQTILLISGDVPTDPAGFMTLSASSMLQGGNAPGVFLAAAVLWLSASGHDPFSLDGLIFRRRVVDEALTTGPVTGPLVQVTGGTMPDSPAAERPGAPPVRELDIDSLVSRNESGVAS